MANGPIITSPDQAAMESLCRALAERADALDASGGWPSEQLEMLRRYGVLEWFAPRDWGGQQWDDVDLIRGYLRLSAACLTTTFVLTQPVGCWRRILASDKEGLKRRLLPALVSGEAFATVGISHLTTSRRHFASPTMAARETGGAFLLDGTIPWVTGAAQAEWILTGATCPDGQQILAVLPTDLPGVTVGEPARLVGLQSTHTAEVRCRNVHLGGEWLLAGPVENVLSSISGAGTGGIQTSALALGLADAAISFLEQEAGRRADLADPATGLRAEHGAAVGDLLAAAGGQPACSADLLRSRANSIALRAAQASAKGSGYVIGHPAGRWCRESLFFLVWSCPQGVMAANLCELAGLGSA